MIHPNKGNRLLGEQSLMDGLRKHFAKTDTLFVDGEKVSVSSILATLQARIDATHAVLPAKAAWRKLVQDERGTLDETEGLVEGVRDSILAMYRTKTDVLADFGIVPKKRRALTSAEKAQRALKAKATREAKHGGASVEPTPAPAVNGATNTPQGA